MSKRRKSNEEAVSLFPFMSILACLIGILTLMISVSMKSKQMDKKEGLTEEEVASAKEHQLVKSKTENLLKEIRKLEEKINKEKKSTSEMAGLEKTKSELSAQLVKAETRLIKEAVSPRALQDLRTQIEKAKLQQPGLQAQIANLQAKIKSASTPIKTEEAVLIKQGGSGSLGNKKLFFVECSNKGISIYENGNPTANIPIAEIETSPGYGKFLEKVKGTQQAMVLFLIRKSGPDAYRWAAGIAEAKYGVVTAKLPIPNDGKIDLTSVR